MKQSLCPLVWIVICVLTLLPGPALAQGPQTCFPSTFGPNDQVGNLHYVTLEKTLFTLGPARITGAVQAIINPIAIKRPQAFPVLTPHWRLASLEETYDLFPS